MDNRIYRSRDTKMVAGVCGGIADMYNLDPTLVRLVTAALVIFSGFTFLLVYVMCAIIIPLEPSSGYISKRHKRPEESGQHEHHTTTTPTASTIVTVPDVSPETSEDSVIPEEVVEENVDAPVEQNDSVDEEVKY